MKKLKILKILGSITILTLIGNVKIVATKNNVDIHNIKENNQKNIKLKGFNFKKMYSDNGFPIYSTLDGIVNMKIDENSETNCVVDIPFPAESNDGKPHLSEHYLIRDFMRFDRKDGWLSMSILNNSIDSTAVAKTILFDPVNNIGKIEIKLDHKFLDNIEKLKKLLNKFFMKIKNSQDEEEIFNCEKERMLKEQFSKLEKSNNGGTSNIISTQESRIVPRLYQISGKCEDIKNIKFEDFIDYYNNIISRTPIFNFCFKNLKEAEKFLGIFKENYFDKITNIKIADPGKFETEKDYIYLKVGKETSKNLNFFNFNDKNNETKESKYLAEVHINVDKLDFYERLTLACLNENYFEKSVNLKDYNIFKLTNKVRNGKLCLDFYFDDENLTNEKKIKKILSEIKKEIINKIDNENLNYKEDLNNKTYQTIRGDIEYLYYDFNQFINNVEKSLVLEKKPFSKRYFKFDENNELESKSQIFAEFCKKEYENVLKKVLTFKDEFIDIYENEGKGINKEEIKYIPKKRSLLPFYFKKTTNLAAIDLLDEFLIRFLFLPSVEKKGLTYNNFGEWDILNKYYMYFSDIEEESMKKYFDSNFKKDIEELKKRLENNELDEELKYLIDHFKDNVLKITKNNLKYSVELLEEKLNFQKKLLNKENLTLNEIKQNTPFNLDYFLDAMKFLKPTEKENSEIEEKDEEFKNAKNKNQEIIEEIANDIKKTNDENLGINNTKKYKEILKADVKYYTFYFKLGKDFLNRFEKLEDQTKNLNKEKIKEVLNSIVIKKYSEMNKDKLKFK